ncbi:MAG TPA: peptide ABC transporter substrate-binding protein, partial [Verrucomicrobiales bacterium]|nr:peptide ABC transporter substrate-binding protein [Verrucomicrobiales bacterium]
MFHPWLIMTLTLVLSTSCSRRASRVETAIDRQILHMANGDEPQGIDPHVVTGIPENNILGSILEGLVSEDPKDLHPVPGVAERWEVSKDGKTYTFFLRENAEWSNGDPVTASDFLRSYQRMLTPTLAAQYAYMLYVVENAEAFNTGKIKDFSKVGFKVIDDRTLQILLENATPYFLSLINHYSWFPVHIPTVLEFGELDERGTRWTRPGNFVGNGPFRLKSWKLNQVLIVEKSPTYWDRETVRLNEIHFYPITSEDAEERAFRSGQIHLTYDMPLSKIPYYQENKPELLRIDTWLGNYFYRLHLFN